MIWTSGHMVYEIEFHLYFLDTNQKQSAGVGCVRITRWIMYVKGDFLTEITK